MTDYKDEIRTRMVEAEIQYELPLELFIPRKGGAELAAKHLRPILYEMVGRTERSGREQSVAAFANMGDNQIDVTKIKQGTEESVSGMIAPSQSAVSFDLHTHPIPGSLAFSTADVRAMLAGLFQYPDEVRQQLQRGSISKHFGVVTQRLEDDEAGLASMKVVTVDDSVLGLTIPEQRDITQEAIAEFQDTNFKPLEQRIGPASDYIDTQRLSFEIPESAQSLKFRSAIPPRVGGKAFRNTLADGDMTQILQGIEYV